MNRLVLEHTFRSPLSKVWRAISDTERFNRAANVPPVVYRDEPQPDGTTRRFCKQKLGLEMEYEELPFKWVHERRFEVTRIYAKGPARSLHQVTQIRPREGSGCVVETTWELEPRGALTSIVATTMLKQYGLEAFKRVYAELDLQLEREAAASGGSGTQDLPPPLIFGDRGTATEDERQRIRAFVPRVRELYATPLIADLERALIEKGDAELRRMQPNAFAREWHADRVETLNTFLAATRAGMLRMRWDVICPHCRGDKQNLESLTEVKESAFCSSCNISFDVDLDRTLEAVFTPHPQVRPVEDAHYCMGGPGSTPHVVYQCFLHAGERDTPEMTLVPGRYRLRATGEKTYRWIDVREEGAPGRTTLELLDGRLEGGDLTCKAGEPLVLEILNRSSRNAVVALETVRWARDSLSAGELVADQRFRDLFGTQVLAPGVKLAIGSVTILFTDLVGSTAMYEKLGDASAFGLVWTHFDVLKSIVEGHRGAIVKTIGDAIMAVFMRPEDALAAADDLHGRVGALCRERGHEYPVSLKIGMHDGPCIAVTLNDRLDYFGSAVNLAARVEAQSRGGDILVSAALASRTAEAAFLRERGWRAEPIAAHCKGFAEPIPMLRFTRGL